jgi:hypothetical protein
MIYKRRRKEFYKKLLASGQKLEGFKGRKIFAREQQAKPRRPARSERSRAENFAFPFRRIFGDACKSKFVKVIFLLGSPPEADGRRCYTSARAARHSPLAPLPSRSRFGWRKFLLWAK